MNRVASINNIVGFYFIKKENSMKGLKHPANENVICRSWALQNTVSFDIFVCISSRYIGKFGTCFFGLFAYFSNFLLLLFSTCNCNNN